MEERERDRYGRASLAEQAGDLLDELWRHPGLVALLAVLLGGLVFMALTRPSIVRIEALQAGDCLWIHAVDGDPGNPDARPAGTPAGAVQALYAQGAERAGCDGSHSHEVVAPFTLDGEFGAPYPGAAALDERRTACEEASAAWTGGTLPAGLEAVTALPDRTAWDNGVRAGACLVARADGEFLDAPANAGGG